MSIIIFHLVFLVLSVNGTLESSLFNITDYTIDFEENSITRVTKIGGFNTLKITFKTPHVIINPYAFNNSGIKNLHLTFEPSADLVKTFGTLALQTESFIGLELHSLSLKRAHPSISTDSLVTVRSLNHLSLESGNIEEVPTVLLTSFPNLESLRLSYNNMSVIHYNAFGNLKRLWYLDLSSNNITTLESGCFNGLQDLDRLDLSNNSLTSLPAVFHGLSKLTELHVRHCRHLKEVDINAFRGTPTLTTLTISHSGIHTLLPGIFDDLLRLGWLQLENSAIRRIPKGVFTGLQSLQYLFLDNNNIERIESHAFSELNLRHLGLSYQRPRFVKGVHGQRLVIEKAAFIGSFADVIRMVGSAHPDLKSAAFEGLTTDLLDLRCSDVRNIETGIFSGLKSRKLDLSGNRIRNVAVNAFKHVIVEEIDLSYNVIETPDKILWGLAESIVVKI